MNLSVPCYLSFVVNGGVGSYTKHAIVARRRKYACAIDPPIARPMVRSQVPLNNHLNNCSTTSYQDTSQLTSAAQLGVRNKPKDGPLPL